MSASISEISLSLTLVVADTSELSGALALATEPLLEGSALEKRIPPLFIPDPHPPTSRPGIRNKRGAVRRACFFRNLIRGGNFIFGDQIPR